MIFRSSRDVLLEHVQQVQASASLRKGADKQNATMLHAKLDKAARSHRVLSRVRILVFGLLYASFLTSVSASYPLLDEVVQSLLGITSLLGVGVLSLLALYLTWRMDQLWNRMIVYYSHLVAIYEKNNVRVYGASEMPRGE